MGPCEKLKKSISEARNRGDEFNQPIPDCDEFGYFKLVQCNLHGCHCADPYGNLIGEVSDPLSNKECENYLIQH